MPKFLPPGQNISKFVGIFGKVIKGNEASLNATAWQWKLVNGKHL